MIGLILIFKGIIDEPLGFDLRRINFKFIGLGFLALFLVWLSKAIRVCVIAQGMGEKVSLWHSFRIYLATCFISHVTPFSAGGTPLQIYLLHKAGISLGKATAITTIDLGLHSIIYLLILLGTISLNVSFLRKAGFINQGLIWNSGIAIASILIIGTILYYLFRHCWAEKIGLFMRKKGWWQRLRQEFSLFKEGSFLLIKSNWLIVLQAFLTSVTYWFFYLLLAPIILLAMDKPVEFFSMMYSQLLFNVAQTLIPTPGGSGGAEVLLSYLFRGITGPQVLGLFVLLWRVYTFYSSLLVGGFFFWRLALSKGYHS